jgi:hypothetical protein
VVGGQLQGGNELVLEELAALVAGAEAEGLPELEEEVPQLPEVDEGRRLSTYE